MLVNKNGIFLAADSAGTCNLTKSKFVKEFVYCLIKEKS